MTGGKDRKTPGAGAWRWLGRRSQRRPEAEIVKGGGILVALLPCCLVALLPCCLVALLPCCLAALLPCCAKSIRPRGLALCRARATASLRTLLGASWNLAGSLPTGRAAVYMSIRHLPPIFPRLARLTGVMCLSRLQRHGPRLTLDSAPATLPSVPAFLAARPSSAAATPPLMRPPTMERLLPADSNITAPAPSASRSSTAAGDDFGMTG